MDGVKILASGFEKDEKVYFAYWSTNFFYYFGSLHVNKIDDIVIFFSRS